MKRDRKALIGKLEAVRRRIGEERDALRDLVDEYSSLLDSSDRASEAMAEAIDALSEHA